MHQPIAPAARLRPMSIGDMLDAAFRLYRRYFLTFIGIAALLQVPMAIVQLLIQVGVGNRALTNWMRFATSPPRTLPGQNPFDALPLGEFAAYLGISLLVGVVQLLLVQNLITGALANAVARSYAGQPVTILAAYQLGWRRFFALVGASLVTFLINALVVGVIFGCMFGSFFLIFFNRNSEGGIGTLAGIVFFLAAFGLILLTILASMFFYTRLLVTTQAIVIEHQGALAGLARSWRLVAGSFWRTIGILLIVSILASVIAGIPSSMVSFTLQLSSGNPLDTLARDQAITILVATIGQIIVLPFQLVIFTMLYYDLRVRKEGYDLELLAQQASE